MHAGNVSTAAGARNPVSVAGEVSRRDKVTRSPFGDKVCALVQWRERNIAWRRGDRAAGPQSPSMSRHGLPENFSPAGTGWSAGPKRAKPCSSMAGVQRSAPPDHDCKAFGRSDYDDVRRRMRACRKLAPSRHHYNRDSSPSPRLAGAAARIHIDIIGGDYVTEISKRPAIECRIVQVSVQQERKQRSTCSADAEEAPHPVELRPHRRREGRNRPGRSLSLALSRRRSSRDDSLPACDDPKAHARMESSAHIGKIVLVVRSEPCLAAQQGGYSAVRSATRGPVWSRLAVVVSYLVLGALDPVGVLPASRSSDRGAAQTPASTSCRDRALHHRRRSITVSIAPGPDGMCAGSKCARAHRRARQMGVFEFANNTDERWTG